MASTLLPLKQQRRLVTYYVDTDTVYTAKVKRGEDCLLDLAFTPSLTGWTFLGWREDTTASGTVLSSEIVGKTQITLYAVFCQTATLSYDGNSSSASGSTSSQTGERYYNNGNVENPTFTLASNGFTRLGYTFSKWAQDSASGTQYSVGTSVTLSESTTFYAVWTSNEFTLNLASVAWDWSQHNSCEDIDSACNTGVVWVRISNSGGSSAWASADYSATVDSKGCNKCAVNVYSSGGYASVIVGSTTQSMYDGAAGTYTFTISRTTGGTYIQIGTTSSTEGSYAYIGVNSIRFYNG